MEKIRSMTQYEAESYFLLINKEKIKCNNCICIVFNSSGEDHICNSCGSKLVVPENKCVSCRGKIVSENHDGIWDTDNFGPYCSSCFNNLPGNLKEIEP